MMERVALPREVDELLAETFDADVVDEARAILDSSLETRVLQAVVILSEGDLERLRHFVGVAVVDFRDVLFWAYEPRGDDEPSTYEELRVRLGLPPEDGS